MKHIKTTLFNLKKKKPHIWKVILTPGINLFIFIMLFEYQSAQFQSQFHTSWVSFKETLPFPSACFYQWLTLLTKAGSNITRCDNNTGMSQLLCRKLALGKVSVQLFFHFDFFLAVGGNLPNSDKFMEKCLVYQKEHWTQSEDLGLGWWLGGSWQGDLRLTPHLGTHFVNIF